MHRPAMSIALFALLTTTCTQQDAFDFGYSTAPLTQDEVLPTGAACTPSGAHGAGAGMNGHVMRSCQTCHVCGGVLQFAADSIAGGTVFNFSAKTCTGGCHSDGRGGPPLVVPAWYSPFPTVTCSPYNGTCGTCNTGPYCCNCHMADNTNSYLWLNSGHHRVHVFNVHAPCTTCHVDPSGPTHANGRKDLLSVIVVGSGDNTETITPYQKPNLAPAPYTAVCAGNVTCLGVCHGRDHHPQYPWNAGCW